MPRTRMALLGLTAVLALAACSKQLPEVTANEQVPADQRTEELPTEGGRGGAGGERQPLAGEVIRFVAQQLEFSEAPTQVPAGQVTFELVNQAGLPHNVTVEGVNGDDPIVEVTGNEAATGTVELLPGSYTYYCSVPGHRQAGMVGTFTVA